MKHFVHSHLDFNNSINANLQDSAVACHGLVNKSIKTKFNTTKVMKIEETMKSDTNLFMLKCNSISKEVHSQRT